MIIGKLRIKPELQPDSQWQGQINLHPISGWRLMIDDLTVMKESSSQPILLYQN
jgi:hypothetical protein